MTDLNMTFVRKSTDTAASKSPPIFVTFPLAVTSSSTAAMLDYIHALLKKVGVTGTETEGREDTIFIPNLAILNVIRNLQGAIASNTYPAPGCIYLVEDHFEEMHEMIKKGCDLYIHTE